MKELAGAMNELKCPDIGGSVSFRKPLDDAPLATVVRLLKSRGANCERFEGKHGR